MKTTFMVKDNEFWKKGILEIKTRFPQHEFEYMDVNYSGIICSDAVVAVHITEECIEGSGNLKVIFVPFAGVNQFPLKKIKEKNIIISNTHWNAPYVAERALALSLSLLGRVGEFHEKLKNGIWGGFLAGNPENTNWISLRNKKVAILGLGNIGSEIAKLLEPFGCVVTGFRKNADSHLPQGVAAITTDLETALRNSEIIYMTLPLTGNTRGIINESNKHLFKDKFLINIGRGKTIEEHTLFSLLKDRILKGAAIDVWYDYPFAGENKLPSKYPIHELDNVIISPHCASDAFEGESEGVKKTMENLASYIETGKVNDIANPDTGY